MALFGALDWGRWGGAGRLGWAEIEALAEEDAGDLVRKMEALRSWEDDAPEEIQAEARKDRERLGTILEAWAEDRYLTTKSRVEECLKQGKKGEAVALLDAIPPEFLQTSLGPRFEELRQKATSP